MPPRLRLLLGLLVAVVLTGGLVGVGTVLADEDPEPPPDDTFRTTPLEDFDTSGLVVRRAAFCDAIDPLQVEAALGGEPSSENSWAPGDRIELPSGGRDVVHEYGCEYAGPDAATASAWVFASPVSPGRARRLVKEAGEIGWCARSEYAAFSDPSLSLGCLRGEEASESYLGLFGDAWLTCRVAVTMPADEEPPDLNDLQDRAGRWCVGVAQAASAPGG